MFHINF
jgi:hypothetical protein